MKTNKRVLKLYPFLDITHDLLHNQTTKLRCGSGYTNYSIQTDGTIIPCPIMLGMKDYYLGQVLLGLEDTLDHMLWLGESMTMRNQLRTLDEVVQRVKRIKIDDVQRVAKDILKEKQYNLAIVGPIQESQEEKLSKIMNT